MSARTVLGAAAVGALMLGLAPVSALALNDPTPIGLPPIQPGEQPTEEPASPPPPDPTAADPATGQVQGGIGGAPLPPLPPEGQAQPTDPTQPIDPAMQQPAATGAQPAPMPDSGAPGLLDDSNAGLGANIWQGSSGAQLVSLDAQARRAADPAVAARSPAPPAADQGAGPECRRRCRYAGAAARRAAARHGLQRRGDAAEQGRRQRRARRRQGRVREGAQRPGFGRRLRQGR